MLDKLTVFSVNARSLVNKMSEIECYAHEVDPDITCITESWATADIANSELALDGYRIMRNDRAHAKGGGCLIYLKEGLTAVIMEELTHTSNTETLWCKINTVSGSNLLLGVCYKSPSANAESEMALHDAMRKASECCESMVIVGDFNHRTIDWRTLQSGAEGSAFLDLTQDLFLTQHVLEPTRNENVLDLVLTSEPDMVDNLVVREPFSDHNIVTFDLICAVEVKDWRETYYDYRNGDYGAMRTHLRQIDWDAVFGEQRTNSKFEAFQHMMEECVQRFIPEKSRRRKKRPWFTRKVERARRKKYHLWKKYQETKEYHIYTSYKRQMNKATKELRKAKRRFEKKLSQKIKDDPKTYYAYVRSKTKTKETVGPLTDGEGKVITDNMLAATIMNDHFASVFTDENMQNMEEPTRMFTLGVQDELNGIDFGPPVVHTKLCQLKLDKAPGPDRLYSTVLREVADEIACPLSIIFQDSMMSGEVPLGWKQANVTPIFKKGRRNLPNNYRPVSLTSQVGKLMEAIIKDAIVDHLREHELIKGSQHGFCKGRSCLTNLLTFLEHITKYVDEGYPVDVVYLDFSKAFDRVPHARLVNKLRAHGIGCTLSAWIGEWLTDRQQRVVLNGAKSDWSHVKSGVPQGSVLGPILFTIYINDIDCNITSNLLKFADDTKLYRKITSIDDADAIQNDLRTMYKWSVDWQMLFNVEKCKTLHIGTHNLHYDYFIGDNLLDSTKEENDLGVLINPALSCSKHCARAAKRATCILGQIKRTFTYKSATVVKKLYTSLVRPRLEYCTQACRPWLQQDVNLLESVQRRMTRLIPGWADKYTYEQRLRKLHLTTLETRRLRADLIEVFKMINQMDNVNLSDFFQINCNNTRGHEYKFQKTRARLDIRKYSFSSRVVNEWNNLSMEAVQSTTLNGFKKHVDRHLKYRAEAYTSQRTSGSLPRRLFP